MHAIILAGGFGTRLKPVVADVPKPLAPVAGKPFLAWLIDALAAGGVTRATLSVYHEWEKIKQWFDAHGAPVAIDYAVEPSPLGTGGAILYALKHSGASQPAIIVNGDTFVEVDFCELYDHHLQSASPLTMVLRHVADTGRYGQIMVKEGIITSFAPGKPGKEGLINAGIYVVAPDLFDGFRLGEAFSFEADFLPAHLASLAPKAYIADDYFIDIGIPEDYARAQTDLPLYVKN